MASSTQEAPNAIGVSLLDLRVTRSGAALSGKREARSCVPCSEAAICIRLKPLKTLHLKGDVREHGLEHAGSPKCDRGVPFRPANHTTGGRAFWQAGGAILRPMLRGCYLHPSKAS